MSTLNRLGETVRESLDSLAEGWHEFWNRAKNAITRFTPESDDDSKANRWGVLSAELHEGADNLTVTLEAPGMDKENFEIFVQDRSLLVRGTKQSASSRKEGRYHITERAYGRWERVLPLPVEVDEASTAASYKNGVLTITLPRSKAAQPRIISIT